jgi:hypothetical protein
MIRRLSFGLAFGVFLFLSPATFAQETLTGAWDLVIDGPQGTVNAVADFKKDGEAVTGSISSPEGEAALKGTMTGSTVTVSFDFQTSQGPINIVLTGSVDGPAMKGTLDFGMGTADFTGKKK